MAQAIFAEAVFVLPNMASPAADDVPLASLACPAPQLKSKRKGYKVSGTLCISNESKDSNNDESSLNKVVPTIVAASKILRTFLQKEHIPNFSEDVETNVIAAEIEEAGEFCFEEYVA